MGPCRPQVSTAWAETWAASAPAHSALWQADAACAVKVTQQVALAARRLLLSVLAISLITLQIRAEQGRSEGQFL